MSNELPKTSPEDESTTRERIQNARDIIVGGMRDAAGKVDFYRYSVSVREEEPEPGDEVLAKIYREQQELWEKMVKSIQEKLDEIDAKYPGLEKIEESSGDES